MKIADLSKFKIDNEQLKSIKGGKAIMCSVDVSYSDGTGVTLVGSCSGGSETSCAGYASSLCRSYSGASCSTPVCTTNES